MAWNIPPLFDANVHSKWQISRSPCNDEGMRETLKRVSEQFSFQLVNVERIDEGLQSDNVRVEGIGHTTNRKTALHIRSDKMNARDAVERTSRLMHALQKAKVPEMIPVAFAQQRFVAEVGGKLWQCGAFVEGDHFRGRIAELVSAAEAIAGLHKAMREYPAADDFPKSSFGTMDIGGWNTWVQSMPAESKTRMLYSEHRLTLDTQAVKTAEAISHDQGALSKNQLVHSDLHPQNLIMHGSEVAAIIDLGNVSFGTLGMDLGMACHRLVRQYMVCRKAEHDERWENSLNTGLRAFLETYQDAASDITDKDIHGLPTYMREILLRKIGYNLAVFAEGKRPDDGASSQIERFIGLLREVDEMDEFFAWK